jgi:histidine triad (HIT) family protein
MTDCLFCRIARGEIPAQKVAENDHALAFRDITPQAPTHVLVIPKTHVADSAAELGTSQAAMLGAIFELAAQVARAEKLDQGWRLVTNVGAQGGQTVPHLHFHLLGGRSMQWPPG